MIKNSSVNHRRTYDLKYIITGAIIGGIIGIFIALLHSMGILVILGFSTVLSVIPLNETIAVTLLGIIIGGLIGSILTSYLKNDTNTEYIGEISSTKKNMNNDSDNVSLQIKEEELDISKKLVQTGDVKIHMETLTEEKTFTVPVTKKILVIEKKVIDSDILENKEVSPEVIRIPVSEEKVEFTKHNVKLEDISIYKQQIEEIKHIEETLKKQKVKVKVFGDPWLKEE